MAEDPQGGTAAPRSEAAPGRIGLYFCRCGPNLGAAIRLGELEQPGGWPAAADVATHEVLCSAEGKAWLARRIRVHDIERVVVAACSPREHEQAFRSVLTAEARSPFCLQVVNLREQVDWLGGDPGQVTDKARRLVEAALRRVALHRDLPAEDVEVSPDVLVIGGGPAGLSAALALAGKERRVVLVERERALGGRASLLDRVFPDLACASCFMAPALDRVLHSDRIEVLTGAEVRRVRGAHGRFEVEIAIAPRGVDPAACLGSGECAKACPVELPDPFSAGLATRRAIGLAYPGALPHVSALDAEACLRARGEPCDACLAACPFGAVHLDDRAAASREVTVGAVVVATGLRPGEAVGPEGVVSSWQLERMLHPDGPTAGVVRGQGGRAPRSVLLAAEGAEEDGDLAARELLKLAHLLRERLPGARVVVAGGLDRIPQLARSAAALAAEGVALLPGALAPGGVEGAGEGLRVRLVDGAATSVHAADLVVVHPPARPADGAGALARLLRIGVTERGFLLDRAASPFEPTATRIAGVYVAGAAAGPRPIAQAIRDGIAAAGLVLASLVPGERKPVEPLAAVIDEALCAGCGVCAAICPFGAIFLGGRDQAEAALPEAPLAASHARRAHVARVHCRACGTCAAACPTGAAIAPHFTGEQIAAEISALLAAPPPAGDAGQG